MLQLCGDRPVFIRGQVWEQPRPQTGANQHVPRSVGGAEPWAGEHPGSGVPAGGTPPSRPPSPLYPSPTSATPKTSNPPQGIQNIPQDYVVDLPRVPSGRPRTLAEEYATFRQVLAHVNSRRAARNLYPILPTENARIPRWLLLCASQEDLESARRAIGWPLPHTQDPGTP